MKTREDLGLRCSLDRQHKSLGTQPTRDPVAQSLAREILGRCAGRQPRHRYLGQVKHVSRATNAKSIPVNRIVMLGSAPPGPPAKPSPVWVYSTITFSGRMRGKSWHLAGDDCPQAIQDGAAASSANTTSR